MTERELERIEIIKQIIGNTRGIGETNADNKALENIDFVNEVLVEILEPLVINAEYEGFEESRQEIAEKSKYVLKGIAEFIEIQKSESD